MRSKARRVMVVFYWWVLRPLFIGTCRLSWACFFQVRKMHYQACKICDDICRFNETEVKSLLLVVDCSVEIPIRRI